jgi:hypothetical protein
MLASVAALTTALPTVSAAQGRGNGNGHSARAEQGARGSARARTDMRQRTRQVDRARDTDRNRNGVADRLERGFVDRNRDGIDDRAQNRYGGANCPPGLANRTPACVPPGQARRMFREGQRVPTNYGAFTSYNDIPVQYREQFNIPGGYNYIYRDNSVYVVDPRTRLIRSVIDLLRP